jgi:hypothetical protein
LRPFTASRFPFYLPAKVIKAIGAAACGKINDLTEFGLNVLIASGKSG